MALVVVGLGIEIRAAGTEIGRIERTDGVASVTVRGDDSLGAVRLQPDATREEIIAVYDLVVEAGETPRIEAAATPGGVRYIALPSEDGDAEALARALLDLADIEALVDIGVSDLGYGVTVAASNLADDSGPEDVDEPATLRVFSELARGSGLETQPQRFTLPGVTGTVIFSADCRGGGVPAVDLEPLVAAMEAAAEVLESTGARLGGGSVDVCQDAYLKFLAPDPDAVSEVHRAASAAMGDVAFSVESEE